jgi:hypothetical protein
MGRFDEGDWDDDPHAILAVGRFMHNAPLSINGKRGQEVLRELEAILLVITMLALIGRLYPASDLLGAVEAKLIVLTDPGGCHRSSIGAMR